MENTQDAVEKDYAPEIEIQDLPQEDPTETPQVDLEDQSQEGNMEEAAQEDQRAVDSGDNDVDKKWKEEKKKRSKIQREKHRIAAELEAIRAENEQLKKYNQTSNQVGQAHYENSLKLKLEQAKDNKRKARELNDIDSELMADEEIASAVADMRAMDSWKAQQMLYQQEVDNNPQRYQQPPQRQNYDEDIEFNEPTERWLRQNPWFDERSPHFDPDKAEDVKVYAHALDANLAKQGREDEYLTKGYFDKINTYARMYDQQRDDTRQERMSNIPNVAPVRRVQATQRQSNHMQLTEDEKFMARNAGISEDDWRKAKIEDIKRQKAKQSNAPIY